MNPSPARRKAAVPRAVAALVVALVLVLVATGCGKGSSSHDMAGMGHGDHGGHGGHGGDSGQGAQGLSDQQDGYRLALSQASLPTGHATDLRFQVRNPAGGVQTAFEPDQTKLLHLYLIRQDLQGYQHLHPDLGGDGTWSIPVAVSLPGPYRVVADFVVKDGDKSNKLVLGAPLTVPGDYKAVPLPPPSHTAEVDGYQVSLSGSPAAARDSELTFAVSKDGHEVKDIEPYLETYGHVTGFRSGDLAFSHQHPEERVTPGRLGGPTMRVHANFPTAGDYRLFLQFQTRGVLHLAVFTVHVT